MMQLTRSRNVSYFGRAAKVWTLLATGNPHGDRVVFVEWMEDADPRSGGHLAGTITAEHMTGDGRGPGHVVHAKGAWRGIGAIENAGHWGITHLSDPIPTPDPIAEATAAAFVAEQRAFARRIDCTPPRGC